MKVLDQVSSFRCSTTPFMTLWSMEGAQAYGSLLWRNGKPILKLVFEVVKDNISDSYVNDDNLDLPILTASKPPRQPTITGYIRKYGNITLDNCALYNCHRTHEYSVGTILYELEFLPTAIWMGVPKTALVECVDSVVASDTRLAGFFGTPQLKIHNEYDPEIMRVSEALGNAKTIWTVHGPDFQPIKLGDTGWLLSIYTDVSEGFSATEGHSVVSTLKLSLTPPSTTTLADASRMLRQIEDILSTFSIESFTFQSETYRGSDFGGTTLVWRLGENREIFKSPMRHQILIDLTDRSTLERVCEGWFRSSSTVKLSRWLFARTLRETDDGLARFINVAQAFEVLGREAGPRNQMPKSQLSNAVELIKSALSKDFDESFLSRVIGLVRSSNKSSYRDTLCHIIGGAAQRLGVGSPEDAKRLSKLIAETRNSVVHMTDDDKGKLDEAFSHVNKLGLQLCFWYAVVQAEHLKLTIPDINGFLINNRNARHGLPNEFLERI